MRKYLVVANQTLGGDQLMEVLRQRAAAGSCKFHLVVPATHLMDGWTYTDAQARVAAQHQLDEALNRCASLGVEVDGAVGDARPMTAVADALLEDSFDEIILSTL